MHEKVTVGQGVAIFLCLVGLTAGGYALLGGVSPTPVSAALPSVVGQVGKLSGGTDVGVGMAFEQGDALKWGEAVGKRDQDVTEKMQAMKAITFLDYDTKVKVIAESSFRAPELRGDGALLQVKVLNGEHQGDVGWVSKLEFFPDEK